MMLRPAYLLYCLYSFLLVQACHQPETIAIQTDTADYFPLETGHYIIYDVSEEHYALTAAPGLLTYQVKETVGLLYTDVTGQPAYQLLRYRRVTAAQPWRLDSLWNLRRTRTVGIRTESGRDIVKVVFPVVEGARWNANQFNTSGADEYTLRNVGLPFSVLGVTFSETATVVQQDDSTLVGQDKRTEVYARRVGLIYKEVSQLHFCTASPGCIGKNQVDYGIRQVYQWHSNGTE